MPLRARPLGFTLVELMVTIAIVAILSAIALPSFSTAIRSSRLASTTNEFIAAVSLARSEAAKSNRAGRICASSDGATCGTNWSEGWIVWADANGNGTPQADEIRRHQQALNGLTVASSSADGFTFTARGECSNCSGGTFGSGTTDIELRATPCDAGQQHVRALRILRTGAVSFTKETCP
jgi:type IV fimbrial biogenesis protein FimT